YEGYLTQLVTLLGNSEGTLVYRLEGGDFFTVHDSSGGVEHIPANVVRLLRYYAHPSIAATRAVLFGESGSRRSMAKSTYSRVYLWVIRHRAVLKARELFEKAKAYELRGKAERRYSDFCIWFARLHAGKGSFLLQYVRWRLSYRVGLWRSPNYRQRLAFTWLEQLTQQELVRSPDWYANPFRCRTCGAATGEAETLVVDRGGGIVSTCRNRACSAYLKVSADRIHFGLPLPFIDPAENSYTYRLAELLANPNVGTSRLHASGSVAIRFWCRLFLIIALAYAGGALYGFWSGVAIVAAGLIAFNLACLVLGRKKD
ncbi:MAG TPA: hypothetical protein VJX67_18675, partial [Blastocatellia bacterium]|nr:hypothetical protein [Blastocatellia bacterium]